MKQPRRIRVKSTILMISCGCVFGTGGCLPENYFGSLFSRLSTNAADFAVQTLLSVALDAVLADPADAMDAAAAEAEGADMM